MFCFCVYALINAAHRACSACGWRVAYIKKQSGMLFARNCAVALCRCALGTPATGVTLCFRCVACCAEPANNSFCFMPHDCRVAHRS